ncbi:DUF6069 family protein [Nocardioides sp. InS609-2]|uniref:DUF6069 family protein n=1 Tax=Nocardioides sp. InS609-2 TaxID=2760705 RepID=UPI0020BDA017|nr:DUF6069 family protein [Nocardioides sp. InS609-2]
MRTQTWLKEGAIVLEAMLAALVAWSLWSSVGDVELTAGSGADVRHVGVGAAVTTALVVAVAGALALRAFEAMSKRGRTWWTVVAAAVWLLSLLGPLGARDTSAWLALTSLHLVVGAIVLFGLRWAHGAERQRVA